MNIIRKPILRMSRQQKKEAYAYISNIWRESDTNDTWYAKSRYLTSCLETLTVEMKKFRKLEHEALIHEERRLTGLLKQGKTQKEVMTEMNLDSEHLLFLLGKACNDRFIKFIRVPVLQEDIRLLSDDASTLFDFDSNFVRIITDGRMVIAAYLRNIWSTVAYNIRE